MSFEEPKNTTHIYQNFYKGLEKKYQWIHHYWFESPELIVSNISLQMFSIIYLTKIKFLRGKRHCT